MNRKHGQYTTKEGRNERARLYQRRKREVTTAIKLASGCVDCGYKEHPAALQFDHVRGIKHADISAVAKFSWDSLMAEIEKCDIVCANCHAIRTANRR